MSLPFPLLKGEKVEDDIEGNSYRRQLKKKEEGRLKGHNRVRLYISCLSLKSKNKKTKKVPTGRLSYWALTRVQ